MYKSFVCIFILLIGTNSLFACDILSWRNALESTTFMTKLCNRNAELGRDVKVIFNRNVIKDEEVATLTASDTLIVINEYDWLFNNGSIYLNGSEHHYVINVKWKCQDDSEPIELEYTSYDLSKELEYSSILFADKISYSSLLFLYLESWVMPIPEWILAGLEDSIEGKNMFYDAFRIIRHPDNRFAVDSFHFPQLINSQSPINNPSKQYDYKVSKEEIKGELQKLFSPKPIPNYLLKELDILRL